MTADITDIRGGSRGLSATYAAVRALATIYDAAGNQMRDWAATGGRTMANGDLLESSILSPLSFSDAEAAIFLATTGSDGVLVESLGWETDAILIRVTIRMFEDTDEMMRANFEVIDYLAGRAIGFTLSASAPGLLIMGLTVGPIAWHFWKRLPPPLQQQVRDDAAGAGDTLADWLVEHPGVLQHLINGGGGLLDGLWDGITPLAPGGPFGISSFTPDTESAAGLLALFFDDGTGTAAPTSLAVESSGTQPGNLAEVIAHLDEVNEMSNDQHPEHNGTIEIQTITGPDGEVRHIVYLPGTDDLTTLPWTQDGDVRDLGTNLLVLDGQDNAYQQGILDAMAQANIGPGDAVLLAGHSQGGMVAAAILGDTSTYNVTNVVTAGAPTAQVSGFPPGSHVLSLEHGGDVVPLMEGAENRDSPQQVTVHFDDSDAGQAGGIQDSHSLPHYSNGAAAVDASTDPSISENLQSLLDNGFLTPDLSGAPVAPGAPTVSSQIFQITRSP